MPYTPPAGNAVNFNFVGGYTAPGGNAVNFNFGSIPAPSFANGKGARKSPENDEDEPLARRRLTSSSGVPVVVASPVWRRMPATILDEFEDDRPRQRRWLAPPALSVAQAGLRRRRLPDDDADEPQRRRWFTSGFTVGAGARPILFVVT